jgi:tRNA-dihydrouridine synthase B
MVQLAGNDPRQRSGRRQCRPGAQIIDIMGCPAKRWPEALRLGAAGRSALVGRILKQPTLGVPVTVKVAPASIAAHPCTEISRIAAQAGVRAIAVHGRTRADFTRAPNTIRSVRRSGFSDSQRRY